MKKVLIATGSDGVAEEMVLAILREHLDHDEMDVHIIIAGCETSTDSTIGTFAKYHGISDGEVCSSKNIPYKVRNFDIVEAALEHALVSEIKFLGILSDEYVDVVTRDLLKCCLDAKITSSIVFV